MRPYAGGNRVSLGRVERFIRSRIFYVVAVQAPAYP